MKRIPRMLATILIVTLANLSSINLAAANATRSPKVPPASRNSRVTPEPESVPDTDPCLPHATKTCIQQDLDDAKNDFILFRGPEGGFADEFLKTLGFDPTEDIDEAKNELDAQSDTEFNGQSNHYDKIHKKSKKRKKLMNALLNNKPLMDMLHRPSPLKFRVVTASAATVAPKLDPGLFLQNNAKDMARSFPSMKSSAATRAEFSRGLTGLNVMVVPELINTCDPGPGIPGGARDLYIAKGVSLATEVVRELIPDDTAMVIPQNVAVVAWGLAKTAELVLEGLHAVYLECNAKKDGDALAANVTDIKTTVNGIDSDIDDVQGTVNAINTTVGTINTTVGGINSHTDSVGNSIITKINTLDGKADTTNNAVNVVGSNVTTINSTVNTINNNVNTVSTNLNTVSTKVDNVNTNVDYSRTTIINNANINAANSLRLMIEADLATADSSTPLAIFETPGPKGYLELARTIVFETIKNLTGATTAQANAILASVDSLMLAGKPKAAYAALRKAYKSAAN